VGQRLKGSVYFKLNNKLRGERVKSLFSHNLASIEARFTLALTHVRPTDIKLLLHLNTTGDAETLRPISLLRLKGSARVNKRHGLMCLGRALRRRDRSASLRGRMLGQKLTRKRVLARRVKTDAALTHRSSLMMWKVSDIAGERMRRCRVSSASLVMSVRKYHPAEATGGCFSVDIKLWYLKASRPFCFG